MNDKTEAAQDPLDAFVQEAVDQATEEPKKEALPTESAPVEDAKKEESTEAEKPTDKFQDRINKVTASKHEERRAKEAEKKRADDLQAKLDELNNKKPVLEKPTLASVEYDEEAFNKATLQYEIQQGVQSEIAVQNTKQKQLEQQAKADEAASAFNEQIEALEKGDFAEKANLIPELPVGVASEIMQLENGAEIVYHLGEHLDKADKIAGMSPMAAMMEIARISDGLNAKPEIKTSAAPDPIEPVSSGSALSSDIGDEMSMDEWMAKYN